ncbi:MAG TPA: hypothetical protein VFD07_02170 [Candidatus Krumholzibacteria bacterium]|nr:hypothetical protein [Candidatus Krumholzibacteria bacterium]
MSSSSAQGLVRAFDQVRSTYASAETVSRADSVVGFGNYNGPIIGAQTATWTAIKSMYR